MTTDIIRLDKPIVVGEKIDPLQHQFLDATGKPYDFTGYALRIVISERDGPATTYTATWDNSALAQASYAWTGVECPTPGHYRATFWAGNTIQRYASPLITWDAVMSAGPVPNI